MASNTINITICAELCPQCEAVLAKKKRPPLEYDSRKPKANIPFRWALCYKGKLIHHIVAYDIDKRFYIWNDGVSNHTVENVSFCVKRLD